MMAGLAREIEEPADLAAQALEAAAWSGMPVDVRSWLGRGGRPPRSSHPACLAVKAAAQQRLDGELLRVLREGFWLRGEALDGPELLEQAARRVEGINLARFAVDLRSSAMVEEFGADVHRAHQVPPEVRARTSQRATLPAFAVGDGESRWLAGRVTPEELRDAVAAAGAEPRELPTPVEVLRRLGPLTTAEVAAAGGLPWTRAAAELWKAAAELAVVPERLPGGELWRAAP